MILKELIEAQGKTVYAFAKEAGIAPNVMMYMARHEVDICNCRAEMVYRVAKNLGVSMESIMELGFEQRKIKEQEKNKKEEQPTEKQV